MPCPFFEPTQPVPSPAHPGARLPLIREYDGYCHACGDVKTAPEELRFECCNHGYSRSKCPCFPAAEPVSCIRYTIRGEDGAALRILCIEEQDHTPLRWVEVRFELASSTVSGDVPAILRAQAEAFGRSYLACTATK
jgi:hypothetical protein